MDNQGQERQSTGDQPLGKAERNGGEDRAYSGDLHHDELQAQAYGKGKRHHAVFVAEDLKPALTELKRIGNNLNQITTKINVGAFKPYNFSEVIGWQSRLYEELVRIGGKGWQL